MLFDFHRPDRIAKSQFRGIQSVHENFARTVASSLGAYLRSYLSVAVTSIDQVSFGEFLALIQMPTSLVSVSMLPFDGTCWVELSSTLAFPILEIVMGGTGKAAAAPQRAMTEIEETLLDRLFRIILHDLREAWMSLAVVDFAVKGFEPEPQMISGISQNEAVVVVELEMKLGEVRGLLNLVIPSSAIKMMRQRSSQARSNAGEANEANQLRVLKQLRDAQVPVDVLLQGTSLPLRQILRLSEGDVMQLNCAVNAPLTGRVGDSEIMQVSLAGSRGRRVLVVEGLGQQAG